MNKRSAQTREKRKLIITTVAICAVSIVAILYAASSYLASSSSLEPTHTYVRLFFAFTLIDIAAVALNVTAIFFVSVWKWKIVFVAASILALIITALQLILALTTGLRNMLAI